MVSVLVLLFLQTQLVLMEHRLLDSTVTRHCLLKIECNRFLQVKTLKTSNRESLMAAIVGREQPIQLQATIDIDEQMAAFFVDYHNHINAAGFTFFVDNFELTSGFNIFKILIKLRIFCRVVVINKGQHNKLNSVETGALYVVLQSMDNQVLHGLNKNWSNVGKWLVRTSNIQRSFAEQNVAVDSNVAAFRVESDSIILDEVYCVHEAFSNLKVNRIGVWTPELRLVLTSSNVWERRNNLQGLTLKGVIVHNPPWTMGNKTQHGNVQAYGPQYKIWHSLETTLNFTTVFDFSPDGNFGGLGKNGSFNGVIGVLQRGEADVTINAMALYKERTEAVDYSMPLGYYEVGLFYKIHSDNDVDWLTYIRPFQTTVWICVLVIGSLMFTSFAVSLKIRQHLDMELTGSESAFMVFHALVTQGYPEVPLATSKFIVFFAIYMFANLMWYCHSSTLFSHLVIRLTPKPFTNLETLYHETDYIVATREASTYTDYFKSGGPIQREISKSRLSSYRNFDVAFQELKKKRQIALFGPLDLFRKYALNDSCQYKVLSGWNIKSLLSFYYRRNLPYRKLFDHQLQKMHESGVLQNIKEEYTPYIASGDCQSNEAEPLTMKKLAFPFIFLMIFWIVACVIVSLELKHFKRPL